MTRDPAPSATIHIIGAGLAGLSAAVTLARAGRSVAVYEQARMAGGRCRSYFDPALGIEIDNGNHLLLSCNHSAQNYLDIIGAKGALAGPEHCVFDFFDLRDQNHWRLRPNSGVAPWWIFSKNRRAPKTKAGDYLRAGKILFASPQATVAQVLNLDDALGEQLWRPVLVSALNTPLEEASARLAAAVIRESLGRGGAYARARIPVHGLGAAFVDPALKFLEQNNTRINFGARLRKIEFEGDRAKFLQFGDASVALAPRDGVIFAAPAWSARELLPGVSAPTRHCAIYNAHFAHAPPPNMALATAVIGGFSEWAFAFPNRLSVTISAADAMIESASDNLAEKIWREVALIAGLGDAPLPAHRIVKEKRATFAATPAQDALRPQANTIWPNVFLAGDWTQTGLPATIEGAIRSGAKAAALAGDFG